MFSSFTTALSLSICRRRIVSSISELLDAEESLASLMLCVKPKRRSFSASIRCPNDVLCSTSACARICSCSCPDCNSANLHSFCATSFSYVAIRSLSSSSATSDCSSSSWIRPIEASLCEMSFLITAISETSCADCSSISRTFVRKPSTSTEICCICTNRRLISSSIPSSSS